jgi:hypothetical protein
LIRMRSVKIECNNSNLETHFNKNNPVRLVPTVYTNVLKVPFYFQGCRDLQMYFLIDP